MALILGIAAAAAACVKAYNGLRDKSPEDLARVIAYIRQIAGVVYSIAKAIFDILAALQGMRNQQQQQQPAQSRFTQTAGSLAATG